MNTRLSLLLTAGGLALLAGAPLAAQPLVDFASFVQVPTLGKPFQFDNLGGTATFKTFDGFDNTIDVTFFFHGIGFGGIYSALKDAVDATLVLTSSTSTAVTSGPVQEIDAGSLTFLAKTPIDGQNVLLQVNFQGAAILGRGTTGVALASDPGFGTVAFSSDFLSGLGTSTADDFAVSLSGITSLLSITGNFLSDFTASGTGIFSTNASSSPIPEPEFYAIAMVALVAIVVGVRRVRQHAAAA